MAIPEVLDHPDGALHPPVSEHALLNLSSSLTSLRMARPLLLDENGRPRPGSDHHRVREMLAALADEAAVVLCALYDGRRA